MHPGVRPDRRDRVHDLAIPEGRRLLGADEGRRPAGRGCRARRCGPRPADDLVRTERGSSCALRRALTGSPGVRAAAAPNFLAYSECCCRSLSCLEVASGLHDGLVAELVIRHTRYAPLPLEPVYAYVNGKQHRLLRNRDVRVPIGVGRVRLFVASGPAESGVWEGRLGADDRVELELSSDRPTPPGQPHPWAVDQLSGPAMVEVQPAVRPPALLGVPWR